MPNKRISELPFLESTGYTSTDVVPLVTYFSAVTGTTVQTNIIDFQNYIINNGYWTSGSTGTNSVIANNGTGNDATNDYAIAIGNQTVATGLNSFSQGDTTQSNGTSSHAEGGNTVAQGDYSHAQGQGTIANGQASHSEGRATTSDGNYSHAEGNNTNAQGTQSHSEGYNTISRGDSSHAQNEYTEARGNFSHAGGKGYDDIYVVSSYGSTTFVHSEATTTASVVAYADNSSILGGTDHIINSNSNKSSIIGGSNNIIGTGSTSSSIIGGTGNTISNNVSNTTILGGVSISATSGNTVYVPSFVIYTEYEPTSSADTAGEPGSVSWSSNSDSLYYKTANGWFILSGVTF